MERESHFHGTTDELKRYVQPPISDSREMKFSTSTEGGEGSHSSWQTSSNHPAVAGASKIAGGTIMMLPDATPFTSCLAQQNVADENRATIRELERISSSLSERSRSQLSEHNNSIGNAQRKLRSLSTASQNPQKSIVYLRDEYGQLRRARRLPDGTLLLKKRPLRDLASLLGWIPKETRPDAEVQGHQSSKAGTVWGAQSTAGKVEKRTEKLADQRRRCEELLNSRKKLAPTWRHDDSHSSQTLGNSDDTTQLGTKKRRKDESNPDSDDEIVLLPESVELELAYECKRQGALSQWLTPELNHLDGIDTFDNSNSSSPKRNEWI